MKYEAAGDPVKGTKWTRTTTAKIASILHNKLGILICKNTVGKLLKEMNYSLRSNRKKISTGSGAERDKQFTAIREKRKEFETKGVPIISVDTKKRELVGLFKNPGVTWNKEPILTRDHDFRSEAEGIAIPYGIYNVEANRGYINIGTSHDTPEFAVSSIAKWWRYAGCNHYSEAKELLILADAGGSNRPNYRDWKKAIQKKLSDRYGLRIVVAHYPTGASKWNPIEHRLFSEVSKNWAGRPLDSYETILNYIRTTTTKTGLQVKSYLDTKKYATGVKVSDEEIRDLSIVYADTLPKWNYTIRPR